MCACVGEVGEFLTDSAAPSVAIQNQIMTSITALANRLRRLEENERAKSTPLSRSLADNDHSPVLEAASAATLQSEVNPHRLIHHAVHTHTPHATNAYYTLYALISIAPCASPAHKLLVCLLVNTRTIDKDATCGSPHGDLGN